MQQLDLGYMLDNENWLIDAGLGYQNLNFNESTDSRRDSIYGVETQINYKLPWHISLASIWAMNLVIRLYLTILIQDSSGMLTCHGSIN